MNGFPLFPLIFFHIRVWTEPSPLLFGLDLIERVDLPTCRSRINSSLYISLTWDQKPLVILRPFPHRDLSSSRNLLPVRRTRCVKLHSFVV